MSSSIQDERRDISETLPEALSETFVETLPTVHFDVFTLFPQMFNGPMSESILKRAQDKGLMSVALHDIRRFTSDRHHVCDEPPYGGGGGMIMKVEPIVRAVETVLSRPAGWSLPQAADGQENDLLDTGQADLPPWSAETPTPLPPDTPVILLTPQGRPFTQPVAAELSRYRRIALICGRYEGVDERVITQVVTDSISIGDFVISGGELAAMVIIDAVTRLIPGALGYELGAAQDSHSPGLDGLLEGPQYTRPPVFRGEAIPEILLSGHHANIARWRREQALLRTLAQRPDLLANLPLGDKDRDFLKQHGWQAEN